MDKTKSYSRTKFGPDVLRETMERLEAGVEANENFRRTDDSMVVQIGDTRWKHDSREEFYADYRGEISNGHIRSTYSDLSVDPYDTRSLDVSYWDGRTTVSVTGPSRTFIESFFEIFESHLSSSALPEEEKPSNNPRIFIGHGRSPLWRDLKDHLHEQHGYPVEAYETGARAGHTVRDILEDMLSNSSFAALVLTGEDLLDDGSYRARQNVVHETGLFQGKLGYGRAIAIVEEGVEEFTNLNGVHQLRFSKGSIKEVFGDVLATLKREFEGD